MNQDYSIEREMKHHASCQEYSVSSESPITVTLPRIPTVPVISLVVGTGPVDVLDGRRLVTMLAAGERAKFGRVKRKKTWAWAMFPISSHPKTKRRAGRLLSMRERGLR